VANILFVQKVFPYDLKLSHDASVTDRRTDDRHANKYGRLKI